MALLLPAAWSKMTWQRNTSLPLCCSLVDILVALPWAYVCSAFISSVWVGALSARVPQRDARLVGSVTLRGRPWGRWSGCCSAVCWRRCAAGSQRTEEDTRRSRTRSPSRSPGLVPSTLWYVNRISDCVWTAREQICTCSVFFRDDTPPHVHFRV